MDKKKSALVNAAIVGLFAAGTLVSASAKDAGVVCEQSNSCQGKGACNSVDGKVTAGKNSCHNHKFLAADKAACEKANGKVVETKTETTVETNTKTEKKK